MELKEMIDVYGKQKAVLDEVKKEVDALNKDIKNVMISNNQEKEEGENYKVTCKEVVSEFFDEDKLLNFFKSNLNDPKFSDMCREYGIIRQKEYIDMQAVENAIYATELDPKLLLPFKDSKKTIRLTVKSI